jgi:exonuclease SbcC
MRPIKLEMIAFGPYSGQEIIDFEQLDSQHLFLVTGPTGAGKTTIFDAISYALYGESSGSQRPVKSLRSDNAPDDLRTEVKLTFQLKGKIHEVHRVPGQMKKKVRGEGFTEQKPEATFIKAGKDHPITGKDNVTEAIKALIGLEVDQFRQIMMIPQGEFRKLLMAKSDERTEILKRIFQTTLYGVLQNKFREEKKSLESEIESSLDLRLRELERIELDSSDDLNSDLNEALKADLLHIDKVLELTQDYINKENELKSQLENQQDLLKKQHQDLIEEKTRAEFNNEKIKSLEKNQKILEGLESRIDEINDLRKQVVHIDHAQKVYPYEENLVKRHKEKDHLEKEVETLAVSLKHANSLLEESKKTYELTTSKAFLDEMVSYQKDQLRLKSYVDQVAKAGTIESKLLQLKEKIEVSTKIRDRLLQEEKQLISISDLCQEKEKQEELLRKKKQCLQGLKDLNKLIEDKNKREASLLRGEDKKLAQKQKVQEEKENYLKIKKVWHMNQAALIASELEEGQACPVCGATEHVSLATLPEDHITEEALQAAENIYNKTKDEYYDIESKIKSLKAVIDQFDEQVNRKKQALIDEGILKISDDLLALIKNHEDQMASMRITYDKIRADLKALNYDETQVLSIDAEKETLFNKLKETEDQLMDLQLSMKEEASVKKTLLIEIPEDLREEALLNKKIAQINERYKQMQDQKNEAEKEYKSQSDLTIGLDSKHEQAKVSLMAMDGHLKNDEVSFNRALEEAGFSDVETYRSFKDQVKNREIIHLQISDFDKEYHTRKETVSKESHAVKDLKLVDIEIFDEKLVGIQSQENDLNQKINRIEGRIKNNQKQIERAKKISEDISEVEEKYKVMGHLSDVLNGQNQKKLTFERFILATYLSDVIEVANQRLHPMTNNRYTLKISQSVMDKRSSSGLDLEVFDAYTGVDRSVKTLSGGESFKASLAMALALAEVVQAYAGGIQLDTVFIDEGFGTLDQESLDSAINCLIALQDSGRLVGIISHVQELKERIRTQLVVEMDDQRSYTHFQLD